MHIIAKEDAFNDLITEHTGFIHLKAKFAGYFIRYLIAAVEAKHCLKQLIIAIIIEYIINPY